METSFAAIFGRCNHHADRPQTEESHKQGKYKNLGLRHLQVLQI